jgi:hypothetical protein
MSIPSRSLVVGNPAKIIKEVSDEMIAWKTEGTALYQQLPAECKETLIECQPLNELEKNRPDHASNYKIWKNEK